MVRKLITRLRITAYPGQAFFKASCFGQQLSCNHVLRYDHPGRLTTTRACTKVEEEPKSATTIDGSCRRFRSWSMDILKPFTAAWPGLWSGTVPLSRSPPFVACDFRPRHCRARETLSMMVRSYAACTLNNRIDCVDA